MIAEPLRRRPSRRGSAGEPRASGGGPVPGALLELAWTDPRVPDAVLVDLASRIPRPKKRAEDLRPRTRSTSIPSAIRPLAVLDKVVLAAAVRANVSPRAALAAVALDARRVRYVLSAMPQWKGRLSGGRLARVLRQHAGAISVAQSEARARASRVEGWTERLLSELELAVALAVGHLTGAEVVRRIGIGRQPIDDGINLATGAEARAALEGPAAVQPILEWATKHRTTQGPALAVWLLLEKLDRERGPTLVAASLDTLAASAGPRGAVPSQSVPRRAGPRRAAPPGPPRGRPPAVAARTRHAGERHRPRLSRHRRDARREAGAVRAPARRIVPSRSAGIAGQAPAWRPHRLRGSVPLRGLSARALRQPALTRHRPLGSRSPS